MTGAEIHKQVMKALGPFTSGSNAKLSRALEPCIVLTAEEAKHIGQTLTAVESDWQDKVDAAIALLTPDQEANNKPWEDA